MKVAFVGDVHLSDSPPKVRKDVDYLGTLLEKLSHIYAENDTVVFLGDIFKTPVVSSTTLCRTMVFLKEQQTNRKRTVSIMGNHDVPYLNGSLLYRTSLGVVAISGLVEVMTGRLMIGDVGISVIPFQKEITCPDEPSDVLLGHCYFESELDIDFSLSRDQLQGKQYKYVILGHDHCPYSELRLPEVTILRPGSLCRDRSNEYNLDEFGNRVGYYQMIVDSGKIKSVKRVTVPVRPPQEVFVLELFNVKSEKKNKFSYLYDVGVMLDRYKTSSERAIGRSDGLSVLSVMQEMKTPPEIISYVRDKYESLGMVLR